MTAMPPYPLLYQINTRIWLRELSRAAGKPITLDGVPDSELDRLASQGFDWIWLLSVWQTGPASQNVARSTPAWRAEFQKELPDLAETDICGSGFAIAAYTTHRQLGGDAALARLRERLARRGLRLMLDFVPNHTGLDHAWIHEHPEYYVPGTEEQLRQEPHNFIKLAGPGGDVILAHGRDPNYPGWPDTLQLDYANPATRQAMTEELLRISGQCDGVRCDMAMLLLPDVFQRTWGKNPEPFWPRAIPRVRAQTPGFVFLAEAYWDLEWTLQHQGFDFAYDKRLYDRLREGPALPVHDHLRAGLDYQNKLARFLENHDEPRAAATFPLPVHQAAAVITFLAPGLRFLHDGQLEGRRVQISPHLCRRPEEPVQGDLAAFYDRLLTILRRPMVRYGRWQLLDCERAWKDNWTSACFLAYAWDWEGPERLLVVVNDAPHASQCYVRIPDSALQGRRWRLQDLLSPTSYDRDGDALQTRGLYLDTPPWAAFVFLLIPLDP